MKPHLIIKLRRQTPWNSEGTPFWRDFIGDKSLQIRSFHPAVDRIFSELGVSFWVTAEYPRSGATWSRAESAAGLDRIYRLILHEDFNLDDRLLQRIRLIPEIEHVRRFTIVESALPPVAQAGTPAIDNSRELIHLRQAHLFSRGTPGVRVAILDTGVDLNHSEISKKIGKRADFVHLEGLNTGEFIGDLRDYDLEPDDEVGHGTHVAGIIAAEGLNMPAGVVPECEIIPVRVLATMRSGDRLIGAGLLDNINAGIKWAVDNGADVINMSLGIKHAGGGLPHEDVIRYAIARGVTVVAASGNDGTDEKYYPGALPGVIAVGAADHTGDVATFSSFGAPVWIISPGTDVLSAYVPGTYALATGTSQAAPFVTGAVALLKSQALLRGARLGDADVKDILRNTSDKPDRRLKTARSGYGLLNLVDACRLLEYNLEGRASAAS